MARAEQDQPRPEDEIDNEHTRFSASRRMRRVETFSNEEFPIISQLSAAFPTVVPEDRNLKLKLTSWCKTKDVIAVVAPPGFGKSTLISELFGFVERYTNRPAAYFGFDSINRAVNAQFGTRDSSTWDDRHFASLNNELVERYVEFQYQNTDVLKLVELPIPSGDDRGESFFQWLYTQFSTQVGVVGLNSSLEVLQNASLIRSFVEHYPGPSLIASLEDMLKIRFNNLDPDNPEDNELLRQFVSQSAMPERMNAIMSKLNGILADFSKTKAYRRRAPLFVLPTPDGDHHWDPANELWWRQMGTYMLTYFSGQKENSVDYTDLMIVNNPFNTSINPLQTISQLLNYR